MMNGPSAPRSIEEYLRQLRAALEGADPALIQDALYDSEEYLRAEIAAHPNKSEADVLELIASTYGAPEEVAAAYQTTEAKVKEALRPPVTRAQQSPNAIRRFFGIYSDPRAYTSLFYMLLSVVIGVLYFTFAVTGLSLSAGLAVLIIGLPFFLAFIGITRVLSLGEGRLLEAVTGERMPRRPLHPGAPGGWWARIGNMLSDVRTWTTLGYLLLMLPLGILYFVIASVGLALGAAFIAAPFVAFGQRVGLITIDPGVIIDGVGNSGMTPAFIDNPIGWIVLLGLGVLVLTLVLHAARGIGRAHVMLAKALLVKPGS